MWKRHYILTHWGRDNIAAISQTTLSNGFSLNKNVWISIKISLKFVPQGQIDNIPALVLIMAWHQPEIIISGQNQYIHNRQSIDSKVCQVPFFICGVIIPKHREHIAIIVDISPDDIQHGIVTRHITTSNSAEWNWISMHATCNWQSAWTSRISMAPVGYACPSNTVQTRSRPRESWRWYFPCRIWPVNTRRPT